MRRWLVAVVLSGLVLSAGLGAHALSTPPARASVEADVYSSAAALRHRRAQPTHWIHQVLYRP